MDLRSIHPPWENPEDIPFIISVTNNFIRGALESLENSVITLLCRLDLIVEFENLKTLGVIGS